MKLIKMLDAGYKIFDTCYYDASRLVKAAEAKGFADVKPIRVKTDTPGLKMFAVVVK